MDQYNIHTLTERKEIDFLKLFQKPKPRFIRQVNFFDAEISKVEKYILVQEKKNVT